MSERDPDPLFDALRDRLADYGQEPPAPLWAGIRQRLPPPVASPRRRRWRAGLLLGLLLLVGAGGGWLWHLWPIGAHNQANKLAKSQTQATNPASAAAPSPTVPGTGAADAVPASKSAQIAAGQDLASTDKRVLADNARGVATHPGPVPTSATTAARDSAVTISAFAASDTKPRAKQRRPVGNGAAEGAALAGTQPGAVSGGARAGRARREIRPSAKPDAGASGAASAAAEADGKLVAAALLAPPTQPAPQAQASSQEAAAAAQATGAATTATRNMAKTKAAGVVQATLSQPAAAPQPGAAGTSTASAEGATAQNTAAAPVPAVAGGAPATVARAGDKHSNGVMGQNKPALNLLIPNKLEQLAGRAIGLQQVGPAPLPAAAELPVKTPTPLVPVGRWAVQVLAGPALTHRSLGVMPQGVGSMGVPTPGGLASLPTVASTAELERPALGTAAQVQLRRTLNGRWAVAAGLGYREYASQLDMRLIDNSLRAFNMAPDFSKTSYIRRRDSYRFLTMPVQASYALGSGPGRLRPALLAGAEAGLYLGGSSGEGPPCSCAASSWGAAGSPYQAFSLGLSLGLDLRYRLGAAGAGPWALLAQPTLNYTLTSLAHGSSSYAARRPYAAGVLLGLSYELR